jgi:two-component system cell cycle response regulator DivK
MMTIAETAKTPAKKILVVEDNEDNRDVVVYRLKAMGYEILEASNGLEALKVTAWSKPDLIFMDLKMPIMDGWEATEALRKTEWGRELPIIALTAHTDEEDRQKAFQVGCDDFVAKPVLDYHAIQKKVQQLLVRSTGSEDKRTHP